MPIKKSVLLLLSISFFFLSQFSGIIGNEALAQSCRALSLNVLQQRLEPYHASGDYPSELAQLAGITRVNGYVVDEARKDLVLIGKPDPSLPPLYLEDLVIALNNARRLYAERRGNTIYYSYPGCSIDPDPQVIFKLQRLANQILGGRDEADLQRGIQQWQDICRSPQQVRVMGVPFHTRFAKVMVTADYDMKRLADGADSLAVPGFTSLMDMTLERAKSDLQGGRPISVPLAAMDRFWFYPGKNQYVEDAGIIAIQNCPVTLLTEAEFLTRGGQISGSGRAHIFAHQFAQSFTEHYQELAQQRPILAELEGLFRLVALAKIIVFKSPHLEVDFNPDAFCEKYRSMLTPVDQSLSGRHNVKGFSLRQDFPDGYQIAQLWLPSCGGVSIEINVVQQNFISDQSGKLLQHKQNVIDTRPVNKDELYWEFLPVWQCEDEQIQLRLVKYSYAPEGQ